MSGIENFWKNIIEKSKNKIELQENEMIKYETEDKFGRILIKKNGEVVFKLRINFFEKNYKNYFKFYFDFNSQNRFFEVFNVLDKYIVESAEKYAKNTQIFICSVGEKNQYNLEFLKGMEKLEYMLFNNLRTETKVFLNRGSTQTKGCFVKEINYNWHYIDKEIREFFGYIESAARETDELSYVEKYKKISFNQRFSHIYLVVIEGEELKIDFSIGFENKKVIFKIKFENTIPFESENLKEVKKYYLDTLKEESKKNKIKNLINPNNYLFKKEIGKYFQDDHIEKISAEIYKFYGVRDVEKKCKDDELNLEFNKYEKFFSKNGLNFGRDSIEIIKILDIYLLLKNGKDDISVLYSGKNYNEYEKILEKEIYQDVKKIKENTIIK